MKKSIFLMVAAFLFAASVSAQFVAGTKVYYNDAAINSWWSSGAYPTAYFFNSSGGAGVFAGVAAQSLGNNYWSITVPGTTGVTFDRVIFFRASDLSNSPTWYNQTYNLPFVDANRCFFLQNATSQDASDNNKTKQHGYWDYFLYANDTYGTWLNYSYVNSSGTPTTNNWGIATDQTNPLFSLSNITALNFGGGIQPSVAFTGTTVKLRYQVFENGSSSPLTLSDNGEITFTKSASGNEWAYQGVASNTNYSILSQFALKAGASYQLKFWYEISYNGIIGYKNNGGINYEIDFTIPYNAFNATPAVGKWILVSVPYSGVPYSKFQFGSKPNVAMATLTSTSTHGSWNYLASTDMTSTNTIPVGQGFAYSVNANAASWDSWNGGNICLTGSAIQATDVSSLSFVGRYFLTGNPFTTAISFTSGFSSTGIKKGGYFTANPTGQTFPLADLSVKDVINPYEGIIVESAATDGSSQSFSIANVAASPVAPAPVLVAPARIKIEAANATGTNYTLVKNNENGSNIVGIYDMSFFNMGANQEVQLYTSKNNINGTSEQLALNTVNTDNTTIPVSVFTTYTGNVSITLTGMDTYDCNVAFVDNNVSGTSIDLTDMASYTYSTTVSGNEPSRFSLVLSPKVPSAIEEPQAKVAVWTSNGTINIISDKNIGKVAVYSVDGRIVFQSNIENVKTAEIPTATLPAGVYMVKANGKTSKIVISD